MRQCFKKLTALSVAAVLAVNLVGVNVYAEGLGSEDSTIEATPYEAEEDVPDSDENEVLDADNGIASDNDQTQDLVDDEVIEDKQVITGFADLDNTFFAVEGKLPIDELGLPKLLPVYINNSEEVVYINVIWTCDDDYDNTEYESYTFTPVWDEDSYELALDIDSNAVPVIEVNIQNVMSIDSRESNVVTPEAGDYDFDEANGIIKGLKNEFLNNLTAEQKLNINLVIPAKIGDNPVKEIGAGAFSYSNNDKYKGYSFINLDLSGAENLEVIGDQAFYNFKSIGTLVLPNSIKRIGQRAFKFDDLTPSIIGELIIPENVTEIGSAAFYNQEGITKLTFKSNKLTELPDQVFRYCSGLEGVIKLPSSVQKMGKSLFAQTNIQTLYLPKIKTDTKNYSIADSIVFGTDLKYLICDKDDISTISSMLNNSAKNKLTYDMEVQFITNSDVNFEPILRLYNNPYNLEKQSDGQWDINDNYKLPVIKNKVWAVMNSSKAILVTDKVLEDSLYPIMVYEKPVITFGDDIDKVYDGNVSILKVNASHPNARPYSKYADPGDVWFRYKWHWDLMAGEPEEILAFDMDEYEVKEVRQPQTAISCTVTVYTYIINDQKQAKIAFTDKHTFTVNIQQAPSIVNPIYSNEPQTIGSGLPEIILSAGDTEGTIKWDDGQTITEGIHDYTWTFTPVKNSVGSSNYTTVTGKASLNFVQGYNVIKGNITNGDIELDKPYGAVPNDDLTITFKPNSGYKLSSASLDGTNIFGQVLDNKYTIRNIQSDHTVNATFTSMETKDVEDVIDSLPDIRDNVITEEVKNDILDAKLHYDAVNGSTGGDITEDAKEKMYEAISKLEQVKTVVEKKDDVTNNIEITDEVHLLENMETEDAEALKNSNDASLKIELVVDKAQIDEEKDKVLQDILGENIIGESYDVSIVKKLTVNSNITEKKLTELKKPIQIVFEIPTDLPSIESGYVREFSIIRFHTVNGQIIPEVLKDEDSNDDSISVSSDKFSTYIIVYKDIKKESGSQGGGSGSYSKTYTVKFESLGGTHVDAITDIKQGKKLAQPVNPRRKGYTFTGWYADEKCTKPFDFTKDTIKANMTLYAGWEKVEETVTYTLLFNTLGGNYIPDQIIEEGQKVLVPTAPSKEGYTFTGWYSDKEGTQLFDFKTETIYADTVLYAGWQKIDVNTNQTIISKPIEKENEVQNDENTNKELFESEEGIYKIKLIDTVDPSTIWIMEAIEGKKLVLKDMPEKEGYVFKGYFTDEKCTKPWNEDETIQEDISLYAGWDKIEDSNSLNNDEQNTNKTEEEAPSKDSDSTSIFITILVIAVIIGGIVVILRKKKQ